MAASARAPIRGHTVVQAAQPFRHYTGRGTFDDFRGRVIWYTGFHAVVAHEVPGSVSGLFPSVLMRFRVYKCGVSLTGRSGLRTGEAWRNLVSEAKTHFGSRN